MIINLMRLELKYIHNENPGSFLGRACERGHPVFSAQCSVDSRFRGNDVSGIQKISDP